MMRRLTVVQCVPALDAGGVEQTTCDIAKAIVDAGHRSVVISAGGRMQAQLLAEGSEHIDLDIGKKSLASLRHISSLRDCLQTLQADIVHARSRLPAWLCVMAMRKMKTPPHFVTSVHGLNSPGFYSGVMLRGEKIICVSETVKHYVLKHWPNTLSSRISVIEPGLDSQKFNASIMINTNWQQNFFQYYPNAKAAKVLLLPGRGTRLKGHHTALQLLARLRQSGMNVCLLCVGASQSGREAYLDELKHLANDLNIRDAVYFTEPQSEMAQVYLLADVVLQLSEKPEAFGRTVAEALCMGKPVIGWDNGGVGENLHRHYLAGAVNLHDMDMLFHRVQQHFEQATPPIHYHGQTLWDMQSQTLALYEQLIA
jgi:glycosyltransferase involved in cell wall biosynthesis